MIEVVMDGLPWCVPGLSRVSAKGRSRRTALDIAACDFFEVRHLHGTFEFVPWARWSRRTPAEVNISGVEFCVFQARLPIWTPGHSLTAFATLCISEFDADGHDAEARSLIVERTCVEKRACVDVRVGDAAMTSE